MKRINTLIIFFLTSFGTNVYAQRSTDGQNLAGLSSVENKKSLMMGKLELGQNYPNPVSLSESTIIRYLTNDATDASIIFYDNSNRKKVILVFDNLAKNSGSITIHGNQFPMGTYTYALIVNGRIVERKEMVIVN